MKIKLFFITALIPLFLFAYKTYEPWYTGPLIAVSSNNLDPGMFNVQPYLGYGDTEGVGSDADTHTLSSEVFFQMGLLSRLDLTLIANLNYREKKHESSLKIGDTSTAFGIQLLKEKELTPQPSVRLYLKETFPTGKYNNLNPKKRGIDSGGSGSYQTTFELILGKVQYWITNHPIAWRLNLSYTLPAKVKVENFNTYGGGFGTKGTITPGNIYDAILGLEFSFTQRWVYAMDITYVYTTKNKFNGNPGFNDNGTVVNMSFKYSYQLSLSPALEYNFNENLGIIGGLFFSAKSKNTPDFFSGLISVTYTF